uniref:Uncharacterized protein n=1 Tax=Taeniopygia guttata TaxID=59729 RepID=A0A674HFY0_TAEGU
VSYLFLSNNISIHFLISNMIMNSSSLFTNPYAIEDRKGRTALHRAAGAASIAGLLLSKGMDTNLRNQAEETPLHFAALHNHGALVGLLVGAGARVNAVTKDFATPLHMASHRGHADVARQLLHHKAPVNAQDKQTALHLAAEYGHGELINLLLSHGAAINASDSSRDTALHCACRAGHLGAVSALLGWARGEKANLLALNSLRKTPLQVAELSKTENQARILTLLRKKMLITK